MHVVERSDAQLDVLLILNLSPDPLPDPVAQPPKMTVVTSVDLVLCGVGPLKPGHVGDGTDFPLRLCHIAPLREVTHARRTSTCPRK